RRRAAEASALLRGPAGRRRRRDRRAGRADGDRRRRGRVAVVDRGGIEREDLGGRLVELLLLLVALREALRDPGGEPGPLLGVVLGDPVGPPCVGDRRRLGRSGQAILEAVLTAAPGGLLEEDEQPLV